MTAFNRREFARLAGVGVATAAIAPSLLARTAPLVRLSSNENPYGASPAALAAIRDAMSAASRYPDDEEEQLAAALARLHGVGTDQILLANGSSEALKLAALAFTGPGASLVAAKPTFEAIAGHARVSNAEVVEVPLTTDYRHDLERMAATPKSGLIYICNPNNPTASITPKALMREFLGSVPPETMVLVDEAYHHYVQSADYESADSFARSRPNVIVLRTFSKIYGMAGLRCGYALGAKETLGRMRRHQGWNNMNLAALVAARASLRDAQFVDQNRRRNIETRARTLAQLRDLGFEAVPSHANFIMVDLRRDVTPLIAALRERGVQVGRRFPALPQHLRVTIGTPAEMKRFADALGEITSRARRYSAASTTARSSSMDRSTPPRMT